MTNNALQLSVQHFQQGNFDQAEETLRGLLREEAGNVPAWCLLGRICQASGRPDEALALFQQAGQLDPHSAEIHSLVGAALVQLGRSSQAQACLEEALRLDPFYPDAYNNLGKVHLLNQHVDEALACFREAVRLQPGNVEMLNNLALVLIGQRRLDEARPLLEQVVRLAPNFAGGPLSWSVLYLEQGELQPALAAAQQAMRLDPQLAAAYAQRGAVLLKMSRYQEAVAPLQEALRIAPRHAQASEHLGVALLALGRQEEALAALKHAAELNPNNVRILVNLVTVLVARGRWAEVVPIASRAMQMQTNSAELFHNLGLAYLNIRQTEMAIAPLEQALKLRPDYPEALCSLGWAFTETGQLPRAAEVLERSLRLIPDFAEALNNLGLVYNQLGKIDESRACYEQAVAVRRDFPQALGGLANVYKELGRLEEAISCYRRCVALDPHQSLMYSNLLHCLHYVAGLSTEEIYQEHLAWARHNAVLPAALRPHLNDRNPERRLRIGYVSADFREHVMGWYSEMVLENHDRRRFEVFCYANQNVQDQTTQRLQELADHWRIIHNVADDAVEEMIRRDRIDLLIDLSSHSGGNRLPLFAHKPAPVQATHFGLQYTTANPAIDYRITDAVVDPPGMTEPHNTEQIVRLPEIHWCYRPDLSVELNALPASSAGHPTFGFLGAFPKITPAAIDVWTEVLHRIPGSRFVALAGVSPQADQRLRDAFADHGIDPGGLTLVGKQARSEYFRLYHRLDVYLDSFPCTGCNTTCDALWMGIPVVMLAGRTGMARQGASPLAHLGLHDLITETPQDYVETAVRLAADLPRLREWRATLRGQMSRSTLMNPQRFTRQLEEAYRWMWRQWCRKPERSFNNL